MVLRYDKKHIQLLQINNYMRLFDKLKRTDPKEKNAKEVEELLQQKNFEEALSVQDIYFDKQSAKDWHTKAIILENLQKTKQALACYSKAVQLDDSYSDAWFKIGLSHFSEGDFKNAADEFAKTTLVDEKTDSGKENLVAKFYYMMSLYMQYLDSHDTVLRHKVSQEISDLRQKIKPDIESEEKFLAFCSKNFKDIVKILEQDSQL